MAANNFDGRLTRLEELLNKERIDWTAHAAALFQELIDMELATTLEETENDDKKYELAVVSVFGTKDPQEIRKQVEEMAQSWKRDAAPQDRKAISKSFRKQQR